MAVSRQHLALLDLSHESEDSTDSMTMNDSVITILGFRLDAACKLQL